MNAGGEALHAGSFTIIGLASIVWQSKRDKIIKLQTQGCRSTNFAYGRVQKVKAANSRVQKYRAAYGRVQKVKPVNSKAVDSTLSYYYKVQSQKYSINW